MFWITENAPNYSMYMYLSSAMKAAYVHWLCRNRVVLCFYSTCKYKVSVSNSSYSVLLQYKFTLLYCILLHGRSNGPHKEDWPDKRKRSWGLLRGTVIVETWVYKIAGKLFAWHWFFWQHDHELPTVVRTRCIHISRALRNTSKVISLPLLTFQTLYFCTYLHVHNTTHKLPSVIGVVIKETCGLITKN